MTAMSKVRARAVRVLLTLMITTAAVWGTGASANRSDAAMRSDAVVQADVVAFAKAYVHYHTEPVTRWTGPTTGPKAKKGAFVVYVSTDERNGGAHIVGQGFLAACMKIGWHCQLIDGKGSAQGNYAAVQQAIALKPNGIFLGGIDGALVQTLLAQATAQNIKVVGWHAAGTVGPLPALHLFINFQTPAEDIGKALGYYVIADSNGKAGAVIIYDALYAIARNKAMWMRQTLKQCASCTLLSYENSPLSDVQTRTPQLVTSLLQRFGSRLTYMLSIADFYYDFAVPTLRNAGVAPGVVKLTGSDGTLAAYNRIRTGDYQVATIPEPLDLQGWQGVDEMNRALNGAKWSGYIPAVHIVDKNNVNQDGGTQNLFIPSNNYKGHYEQIWGVTGR